MPKATVSLKKLRLEAGVSQNAMARLADIDRATLSSAESGKQVSELTIAKITSALSAKLNREISEVDIIEKKEW